MLASLSLFGLSLALGQQTEKPAAEVVPAKVATSEGQEASAADRKAPAAQTRRAGRPRVLPVGQRLSEIRLPGKSTATPAAGTPAAGPAVGPVLPGASAGAAPAAPAQATGPVGEIVIPAEAATQDFGTLREGEIAKTEVSLVNTGEGDLVISAARATCGCTKSEIFLVGEDGTLTPYQMESPIPPGGKFQVNVGVDSTRKKGAWSGSVSLFSNDPVQPDVIQLRADVQQMFEISPLAYMNFEQVRVGTEKTAELTVSSPILDAFLLKVDDATLQDWMQVDLTPLEPGPDGRAKTWKVTGRILGNAPEAQRWTGPINLITDQPLAGDQVDEAGQPKMHEVTMTAMAQIQGLVTANPFYLSMGIVPPGNRQERSFTLEIHDEGFRPESLPVTVEGRTPEENELWAKHATVTATRLEDGNFSIALVLEDLPDTMSGPFGGTVQVAVGHPTKDVVSVPFSGVCRSTITNPQTRPAVPPPARPNQPR